AAADTPVNPNAAAIKEMTKKITAHRNIDSSTKSIKATNGLRLDIEEVRRNDAATASSSRAAPRNKFECRRRRQDSRRYWGSLERRAQAPRTIRWVLAEERT